MILWKRLTLHLHHDDCIIGVLLFDGSLVAATMVFCRFTWYITIIIIILSANSSNVERRRRITLNNTVLWSRISRQSVSQSVRQTVIVNLVRTLPSTPETNMDPSRTSSSTLLSWSCFYFLHLVNGNGFLMAPSDQVSTANATTTTVTTTQVRYKLPSLLNCTYNKFSIVSLSPKRKIRTL